MDEERIAEIKRMDLLAAESKEKNRRVWKGSPGIWYRYGQKERTWKEEQAKKNKARDWNGQNTAWR